jgi:threonine/homoserine/homoserine lactone efflux protein
MTIPTHHLVTFLLTVYVVILIPGPSVLFIVGRGVSLGRRAALASVAGNSCGFVVQLVLVSIGVGSIVARSDTVFSVLKLLGALYLVYLGVRNIRDRRALAALFARRAEPAGKSTGQLMREGLLVGATNPKGFIVFTVLVPQFIQRSSGHVTFQIALLGAIVVVIAFLSDCVWAVAAGTAREWLGGSPRRLERMSATGGLMLIGLGVGLALTQRRS